jgi:thiomorpholine-carboxylate dehydrogenase
LVKYFDESEVAAALKWDALIAAMERALAAFSMREVIQPVRQILTIEPQKRMLGVMPAVTKEAMGLKAVSFYPGNEGTRLPTHMAMIILFRTETGEPLAAMDGRLITEMRTAAVSAAVTKHLAREDANILALLGSGVQAQAHLEALSHVRKFGEVRVWSRTSEHAEQFAKAHGAIAMDAESAVRGADVIVTATSSTQPVLKGAWLKPGAHVNAVGACLPTWRELDDDVTANGVIVDSREAAMKESGDVILSGAEIVAEAGELFAGVKSIPASRTTVFKSLGLAVEDIATAQLVFEAHEQRLR